MKDVKVVFAKMGKVKKVVVGSIVGVVAGASQSFAALDLTGVTVDPASFEAIALLIITAAVGFWAIKKGIALIRG